MALFEVPGWSMPPDARPASNPKKRKRPGAGPEADKIQTAQVNLEKLMKSLDSDKPTTRPAQNTKASAVKPNKHQNAEGSRSKDSGSVKRGKMKMRARLMEGDKSYHPRDLDSNQDPGKETTRSDTVESGSKKRRSRSKRSVEPEEADTDTFDSTPLSPQKLISHELSNPTDGDAVSKKKKKAKKFKQQDKKVSTSRVQASSDLTVESVSDGNVPQLTSLQSKMKLSLDGARFRCVHDLSSLNLIYGS